ncbi:MAG: hypothetical protein HOL01_09565 [Planctomycetaceae bacterium]|nr:hypothetical protein [Planctomycetaceae bacterium]
MIVGYHVIFGMYGFWLPNDPRGSWSDFVGSWELFRFGRATKTDERRSVAWRKHNHRQRAAAKRSLKHPTVVLSDAQAEAVAAGFSHYFAKSGVDIWACAIMPGHVHLVVGRAKYAVENLVIQVKGDTTQELVKRGIHPLRESTDAKGRVPKCFARGEWKVFLDPEDVPRAIRYVEENPLKEGREAQDWEFVQPSC